MSAQREQVVAAILGLNGPEVPFEWSRTDTGTAGSWKYADAQWAGLLAAGSVDATYRLLVALHDDGTYSLTDRTEQTTANVGVGGASVTHTRFRGTVRKKSFNSSVAPVASDHGRVGHTFGWNFDSNTVKAPVRDVLARHGWTQRKVGLWARLMGRTGG